MMMEDDPLSVDRRIWLYPSGRVDLYWCVAIPSHDDPAPLEVMTLLGPLVMLNRFVRSAEYDRVWSWPRRRIRRHFDWRFVASMDVYDKDRRSRSWETHISRFGTAASCGSPGILSFVGICDQGVDRLAGRQAYQLARTGCVAQRSLSQRLPRR